MLRVKYQHKVLHLKAAKILNVDYKDIYSVSVARNGLTYYVLYSDKDIQKCKTIDAIAFINAQITVDNKPRYLYHPAEVMKYFKLLQLPHGASDISLVKSQYKQLAKTHHPDKGGDRELFETVQTAYDYLMNYFEVLNKVI